MFQMVMIVLLSLITTYLVVSLSYNIFFLIKYFSLDDTFDMRPFDLKKFVIIVPAHNEMLIIDGLMRNLKKIDYPPELLDVFVIADNCTDVTASICSDYGIKVLERNDNIKKGKGYAINYAFENIPLESYDAFLIIDADTYVDKNILEELSKHLSVGEVAIQCFIEVPNKNESWFTQLISVARLMNGLFYHYPKSQLGLSSYLMGSGICLATNLIKKKGWTAFSIAEDWEYYAQLLLDGYRVAFAKNAVVYQYESKSLEQATSQRLRWSSGRWKVTKTLGIRLLFEGLKKRNLILFDSSLPLVLPNYSLQASFTVAISFVVLLSPVSVWREIFAIAVIGLLLGQIFQFIVGAFVAGSPRKTFYAALRAPLFLLWKSVIDIICITGLYRGKNWVRTKRHRARI